LDLFGHAAASFLVGRSVPATARDRSACTAAALAAGLAPDLDALTYLIDPALFFEHHQVFTHNLLALAVLPALVAWAVRRWRPGSAGRVYGAALASMTLHLLGDLIAQWPVPLLWPLSDARFHLGLLQIDFSPVLDAILMGGALLMLWDPVATHTARLRGVAAASLLTAVAWLTFGPGTL
jgi:membrane-bound metal-dependent hydrolase YbcI (DUF457 family)